MTGQRVFATALAWSRDGMDFADALHLAAAPDGFRTFDKRLVRRAAALGLAHVDLP